MKKYMGLFSRKKKVHFDSNGKAMLELKSIDPYPEDVGKDIVRMDNASMDTLDVESGDFVKIMWGTSGTRQYLNAKCLPLDSSDKNKNVIRMPGGEVNNIGIDCVIVEKIDVTSDEETSQKIMLMPVGLNAMMYLAFSQEMDNCKNIVDEKNIIETYENTIVSPYQSSIITTCFDNPCEFKVIGSDTDLSSIFITKNTTFEYHIPELTETPTSEYVGMVDKSLPNSVIVWENFYDEKKISSDNSNDQSNPVHELFDELDTFYIYWKPKKTISVCDKILESDPENVTVLSYKSYALEQAYHEKENTKYLEPLLSVCDTILELDSEDKEILERKASCLQHLERYDDAIAYYDKCIELERGSWYKWHSTADTLIQLGRYTEASQCYVQAQHMADRSEGYWMSKYNSLAKLDRTKEEEDAGLKMSCLMMYSKSLGEKSREFGD